jgi:hypothetical protein
MTVNYTTNLALAQPVTGTESGTWGDDVNNGLTSYLDNAIAGTVTLTGDGAVTLSNTQGTSSATNIVSSLTGAGTVTAQFAVIRVTGTLTTAKVLTAPSSSRQYVVTNAATGSTVTVKASGQSGVSVAVGETATVYFNGTDYVKSATTLSGTGTVTSVGWTGGIVSVATSTTTPAFTIAGTSGGVPYFNSGTTWATSAALTQYGIVYGGGAGAAPVATAAGTTGQVLTATTSGAPTWQTPAAGGVSSITGTSNQVIASASTGAITLSTPQSIGTTSSVQFGSFGVGTAASGTSGEIRATNNVTAYYSDDRLKTRLGVIENALDKVRTLDSFYYEANETAQELGYTPIREVGISAQQVQAIMPEVVAPAPIDDRYLTVRYERLVPLLLAAIKELEAKVQALESK